MGVLAYIPVFFFFQSGREGDVVPRLFQGVRAFQDADLFYPVLNIP